MVLEVRSDGLELELLNEDEFAVPENGTGLLMDDQNPDLTASDINKLGGTEESGKKERSFLIPYSDKKIGVNYRTGAFYSGI